MICPFTRRRHGMPRRMSRSSMSMINRSCSQRIALGPIAKQLRSCRVSLAPRSGDAFTLRFWGENPAAASSSGERAVQLSSLGELADQSLKFYDRDTPALIAIGRQLFDWLDGETRQLSQELNRQPAGRPVALCIECAERLSHLPWETLHDGTDFLVNRPDRPVLPVRWHNVPQEPLPAANRALHLLYMASSPEDVQPVLEFETEEGLILQTTRAHGIGVTTEETGCLTDLRYRTWPVIRERSMRTMAIGTAYVIAPVFAAAEVIMALFAGVASKTGL